MNAQARTRVGIIGAGNIATIAQLPTLVNGTTWNSRHSCHAARTPDR
jgi:hypothetical protein